MTDQELIQQLHWCKDQLNSIRITILTERAADRLESLSQADVTARAEAKAEAKAEVLDELERQLEEHRALTVSKPTAYWTFYTDGIFHALGVLNSLRAEFSPEPEPPSPADPPSSTYEPVEPENVRAGDWCEINGKRWEIKARGVSDTLGICHEHQWAGLSFLAVFGANFFREVKPEPEPKREPIVFEVTFVSGLYAPIPSNTTPIPSNACGKRFRCEEIL